MSAQPDIATQIDDLLPLFREKLGVRGKSLDAVLRKARYRLPRRVYASGRALADIESMAVHPKLCLTLDSEKLGASATEVREFLDEIDLADRRKGWWLGMLGGMSFNLILLFLLSLALLRWRGLI